MVGDSTYCDRYWECVDGQPELYDCPNGLVFAGKNRGVTEGCDYPWRAAYCVGKQTASEITLHLIPLITQITLLLLQTVPYRMSTATGCMESSATRHPARVTGHAGMEPQPSSCASVDCCTTSRLTVATGLR